MAEIKELISKVFILSPDTKKKLEEAYPFMDEKTKEEFLSYLEGIIQKQVEILTYIIRNNPDFISELKAFNASNNRKNVQNVEKIFAEQEEMDLLALEKELANL